MYFFTFISCQQNIALFCSVKKYKNSQQTITCPTFVYRIYSNKRPDFYLFIFLLLGWEHIRGECLLEAGYLLYFTIFSHTFSDSLFFMDKNKK